MHSSMVPRIGVHRALTRSRNQNRSEMQYLLVCDASASHSEVKNQWTLSINEEQKPQNEQHVVSARM